MYPDQDFLIVDDDTVFREQLTSALQNRGYRVRNAASAQAAIAAINNRPPGVLITDLRMPGDSGLELLKQIQNVIEQHAIRVVVLTGYGSIVTAVEAMRLGCVNYLTKPVEVDAILDAIVTREVAPAEVPRRTLSLREIEREHIDATLLKYEGNISRAAKELGIHRRSLQRKIAGKL